MTNRKYEPGEFRVVEMGNIDCKGGKTVRGAIIEFPAGPPAGMTWGDVWSGAAFKVATPVCDKDELVDFHIRMSGPPELPKEQT